MISINFESVQELEKVLQALSKEPYGNVAPLIANIHSQAMPQISKSMEQPVEAQNDQP
jgi:hypothetical protein